MLVKCPKESLRYLISCYIRNIGPESDDEHWAIGWGRTRNGRGQGDRNQGGAFVNILQKLKLPLVPYEKCRTWGEDQGIKTSPFSTLATDKYLCAGGRKSKNSKFNIKLVIFFIRKNNEILQIIVSIHNI